MTRRIGIITGISGVGKTWLLRRVGATIPMQVLSASALIFTSLTEREGQSTSHDDLRARNIAGNQSALVDSFNRHVDPETPLVLLDAHVIIDSPDGLVHIGSEIFRKLDASFIVFVSDEPQRIYQKRELDEHRSRPKRSVDLLAKHQEMAIEAARQISDDLRIPIYFVSSGDEQALMRALVDRQKATRDV